MKLWTGRFKKELDPRTNDFNRSLPFDSRMYRQDIEGSVAHAEMLGAQGIISADDMQKIVDGLKGILADIESGKLQFDDVTEDIHTFVEAELTARIGDAGKRLHTARSRNDQVALDMRLYLANETDTVIEKIGAFACALADKAAEYKTAIMPGYTHLQRAQPISFAHHLLAYAMMLSRDAERFADSKKRTLVSPIGSCALAGTTYSTDRYFEAEKLGMSKISLNSIDGVSDRDFCLEFLANCSILMTHLSRYAEEVVLWSSFEFGFVELDDAYTTGSSIMPQKKNPDMAELVRGKTGRVNGDLVALLTTMKGLPLAYNKDMQEDKEAVFDALDTVKLCLDICVPMTATMTAKTENMKAAAQGGFIGATDLADYLVGRGLPFRSAYKISGQIVAECIRRGLVLETLPLEVYQSYSELIEEGVYDAIDLEKCLSRRTSEGGPALDSVNKQIEYIHKLFK
jgi:argininosuccinate lyase